VGHVADGLEHHEQGVVVAFQLGPLVGVHGVLDREFVQSERGGDALDLLAVRLVQADPDESSARLRTSAMASVCVHRPGNRVPPT
jgi:hypothetical protein